MLFVSSIEIEKRVEPQLIFSQFEKKFCVSDRWALAEKPFRNLIILESSGQKANESCSSQIIPFLAFIADTCISQYYKRFILGFISNHFFQPIMMIENCKVSFI